MNSFLMILMTYVLLYVLGLFFGKMSTKNIVFGVTIQDEHLGDERLQRLKSLYLKAYTLVMGIIMILFIYLELDKYNPWYFMFFTGLWLIVSFVIYSILHNKTKEVKKDLMLNYSKSVTVNSASLTSRSIEMPMIKTHFSFAFIVILITGLITFIHYDDIKNQIPMHYDMAGNITDFANKNIATAYMMVVMQVFLTLVLYLSTYASIKYAKRKINPKQPKTSEIQYKIAMKRFSKMMAVMAIILNITFMIVQLSITDLLVFSQTLSIMITVLPVSLILVLMVWFFISTGISGERIPIDIGEKPIDVALSDYEDDHWKWGMFYLNKNDSSIFVAKRFGGGFTLNFGNKIAILILIGLVLFIILSIVLPLLVT